MKIAAGDPGLSGSIVIIDDKGKILDYFVMPLYSVTKDSRKKTKKGELKKRVERYIDIPALWKLYQERIQGKMDLFIVEDVHGVQGSGAASAFKFGSNYMALYALAVASGIPVKHVTPRTWQKPFHKKGVKELTAKEKSMYYYKVAGSKQGIEFPDDHDGLIDAWLMCEWGRRNLRQILHEVSKR